ncbi:glycosyltransferase family 39 protein, partial [Candidatus Dependentiae bacterium]|nr:glycosyltransferase family 39 protein [Candidatus Dependentiae bacterium]
IYPKKYFFYIGISWVVLTVLCKFISPIMNIVFLIFFVYAMMLLYAVIKYNKKILHEFSAYIIIGIILFTGFYMRWNALIFYEGIKLEYDAEDYYNISIKYSKGLFDTAAERPPYIREPFYIWILKCGFLFFPKTPEALRIIALIISLISIYSTFLFGKKYLGYLTGLGTSAYMSVSESFINAGVQGLREDLYLCILILFLYQLIKKEKKMSFGITIGISAGLLMLVRITAFSFIIPLIFIFSVIHRWKPINIVISLIVPFTMVIPHLIFNYNFMDSKDILYSGNIHTSFYRNYEFAGKPGFITREEFKTDPYHGGNISAFKYLFFEHSPVQIISGFTKGTIRIYLTSFTYDTLLNKNNILLVIYIIGIIGLIFSNQRWIFLIWFFISFPMLYLSSFVIVERLLLYLIPFQLYGIFAGWIKVSDYGKRFFRK